MLGDQLGVGGSVYIFIANCKKNISQNVERKWTQFSFIEFKLNAIYNTNLYLPVT